MIITSFAHPLDLFRSSRSGNAGFDAGFGRRCAPQIIERLTLRPGVTGSVHDVVMRRHP
jgi:hypothetical protein